MENKLKQQDPGPSSDKRKQGEKYLFLGAKRALIGGLLAGGISLAGQWFIGHIYSGAEARRLLEAIVPSARDVATSVVTGSGTILALMLTMLGLTSQAKTDFDNVFYQRIDRIGLLSTIAFAASMLLLQLLNIPLQESKNVPGSWYSWVYYTLIVVTAGLVGLMIAVVLMLLNALRSLLTVLRPGNNKGADDNSDAAGTNKNE